MRFKEKDAGSWCGHPSQYIVSRRELVSGAPRHQLGQPSQQSPRRSLNPGTPSMTFGLIKLIASRLRDVTSTRVEGLACQAYQGGRSLGRRFCGLSRG